VVRLVQGYVLLADAGTSAQYSIWLPGSHIKVLSFRRLLREIVGAYALGEVRRVDAMGLQRVQIRLVESLLGGHG